MARRLRVMFTFAGVVLLAASVNPAVASPALDAGDAQSDRYVVEGVRTAADRNRIARSGASIDGVDHGVAEITALPSEARRLRTEGFRLMEPKGEEDFPAADA